MSISTQVGWIPVGKSRNSGRSSGEDRISNLPESVISHILSCLPTKDAIRTCVLSKDWEYKWTSIYNIDIDDGLFYSDEWNGKTTFVDFVERVLLFSQNIKDFRLSCCGKYEVSSRMTTWISVVLRRNVESFDLRFGEPGIVLPRTLHNNSSLRNLNLQLPCTIRAPFENRFPNLTSLCLNGVEIRNVLSNSDTLILTFPVLETLELTTCKWLNVKFLEIHAPALTSFTSKTLSNAAVDDHQIKICGLSLVKFETYGGLVEKFILTGPRVVYASLLNDGSVGDLQLLANRGLQIRKLMKEFPSLEDLELAVWVTEAIAQSKQRLALPRYEKLRQLFLAYGTNIETLLELLHSAPFLKVLIVETFELHDYDYDAVESVPSCIASHLEKLVFHYYAGKTPEVNLAKFLFKKGIKLRKCKVNLDDDIPKNEIVEQLSMFPKVSTCMSVVVKEWSM